MLIIEPIAAIENAPLATPSRNTVALNGHTPSDNAAMTKPARAIAEAMQPPTVQTRNDARRLADARSDSTRRPVRRAIQRPSKPLPATATSTMPNSTPPCCTPDNWVDSPGV